MNKYTLMRKTGSGRNATYRTVTKTPNGFSLRMFDTFDEALRTFRHFDNTKGMRVVELEMFCDKSDFRCEALRAWDKYSCLDSEFLCDIKELHDEIIFTS